MDSRFCPGQFSSNEPLTRPTNLLDLPDELLSRIINYLIPRHVTCPRTVREPPRNGSIGLVCIRLFKLVRKRLVMLDFVCTSSITEISHIPKKLSRNIELFTRIASPFAEVLRLPTDFCPKDPALTSLGWCPHLRELSISINEDPDQLDMEQYFIGHKKLEVLTLHTPGKNVLAALAYASLNIRKLTLVALQCSEQTLKVLDKMLSKMSSLQSLTISFLEGRWKSNRPVRMRRCLSLDPKDRAYLTEPFIINFAKVLRKNYQTLLALRKVSLWSGRRGASLLRVRDDIGTKEIVNEIRMFAFYVHNARELAFKSAPDLKLHRLRLRMYKHGEPILEGFMRGLVDASTQVIIHLHHVTICYPALVDPGEPPIPIITELRIEDEDLDNFLSGNTSSDGSQSSGEDEPPKSEEDTRFYKKYLELKRSAVFDLETLVVSTMDSVELLLGDKSRKLLSHFLHHNNLKTIMFTYNANGSEELEPAMSLLQLIGSLAHNVTDISLPFRFAYMSEVISTAELRNLRFAKHLRMLRLCFITTPISPHIDFQTYEEAYVPKFRTGRLNEAGESLAERLPEFLEKIRKAFPNLTHLSMDPQREHDWFDENTFYLVDQAITNYEEQTGVDASSVRSELETWIAPSDSCKRNSL